MKYDLSVSESGAYILVRVKEPMTRTLACQIAIDLISLSSQEGITRYLYDVRTAPNVESVVDNYEFANKDMKSVHATRKAHAAILVAPGDRSHDFTETVMRNAGYDVRLFVDDSEAVRWLEESL